jgi:hypothetical protein
MIFLNKKKIMEKGEEYWVYYSFICIMEVKLYFEE